MENRALAVSWNAPPKPKRPALAEPVALWHEALVAEGVPPPIREPERCCISPSYWEARIYGNSSHIASRVSITIRGRESGGANHPALALSRGPATGSPACRTARPRRGYKLARKRRHGRLGANYLPSRGSPSSPAGMLLSGRETRGGTRRKRSAVTTITENPMASVWWSYCGMSGNPGASSFRGRCVKRSPANQQKYQVLTP